MVLEVDHENQAISNSSAQTEEELLKTIAEIACTGSAADERRR